MKKQYIGFLMVVIGICSACSVEQELVIVPKNKKKYVSEQQCIELEGDIIVTGTDVTGAVADLSKTLFLIMKSSLGKVNDHVEGEKSCLDKVQRTDIYTKKIKILHELERCNDEIQKMQQRLDDMMTLLV